MTKADVLNYINDRYNAINGSFVPSITQGESACAPILITIN